MKTLVRTRGELQKANRWDIDFHLPAEGIKKFPKRLLKPVGEVADISKDKRDPSKKAESVFQYIDISSVDVAVGVISSPQELEGSEAPSRARKVVRAFDLVISTCRPTRGGIALVPPALHDQIASTGFSVVRSRADINPLYLHYALRLPSTLEQFRKWSTGSSYPAILDDDVAKTLIPVPDLDEQDAIAEALTLAYSQRNQAISSADGELRTTLSGILRRLGGGENALPLTQPSEATMPHKNANIRELLEKLPPLTADGGANGIQLSLEQLA